MEHSSRVTLGGWCSGRLYVSSLTRLEAAPGLARWSHFRWGGLKVRHPGQYGEKCVVEVEGGAQGVVACSRAGEAFLGRTRCPDAKASSGRVARP